MPYTRTTIECYSCGDTIPVVDATAIRGLPYCEDCVDDFIDAGMTACCTCGGYFDPSDITLHHEQLYCEDCYSKQFVYCDECGERFDREDKDAYHALNKEYFCNNCYDDIFTECYDCGVIVESQWARETPDDSRRYCDDCWGDFCCECDRCGDVVWIDDATLTRAAHGPHGARYECEDCRSYSDQDYWCASAFNPSANTFDRVGSERCFGIELEYNCDPHSDSDVDELNYFGRKGEHCGVEFYSSILKGDKGLDAAESLGNFADDNNWRHDNYCGYHLHLDMRDENARTMRSLAYAYRKTYHVWKRFVSDWRANRCTYCHAPGYSAADIRRLSPTQFTQWAYNSQRFLAVNWSAYDDHTTVEIRLHSGTRDPREITNWVIAHTRFADWALSKTLDEIDEAFTGTDVQENFRALSRIWGDANLTAFYRQQALSHDQPVVGQNASREAVTV